MIRFGDPEFLLLLPVLALILWALHRLGPRARGRRGAFALALRGLALALLVIGLARPRAVDEVQRLAVAFVVDVSESVPTLDRDAMLRRVQRDMERMPAGDQAALVVFGDRPSIELPLGGPRAGDLGEGMSVRLDHLESRVSRTETDIAAALEFAAASLPRDAARRVVLVSDGNETSGDLLAKARELRASGVRLDARPIRYRFDDEVMVEGLIAADKGRVGEPLQLRAVISAQSACEASLDLQIDGVAAGAPRTVALDRGTNVFRFSPVPTSGGVHRFELRVRADRDGNPGNNVGRAASVVGGSPVVLVASTGAHDERVAEILVANGVSARAIPAADLPADPAGYVGADAVVLDDVPAFALSKDQLRALADAVRELGVGLVVFGGDQAYGPGGYRGTELAELIPVDLDTQNKKTMPKGALVIVLHSVEFDSGNTWAVRICRAAIAGMNPTDEAGVVYMGPSGDQWLFDLQAIGDGADMGRLIDGCYPGDMQSFQDCFSMARDSLLASDAAVKHIVVISDGDPQAPTADVLKALVDARVTISTVCIAPHGPGADVTMKDLARIGGGRTYTLAPDRELHLLPRLMLKEAATLRRESLREVEFVPVVTLPGSPILRGLGGRMPPLLGYCVTSIRAGAETVLLADDEENDPLLATWHAGLGKVVAFTSDVSSRWAREWLGWPSFGPFVTQVVRASVLDFDESPWPARVVREGDRLRAELIARDADGTPATDLEVSAVALTAGAEPAVVFVRQDEAGVYAGDVPARAPGHYVVQFAFERDGRPIRAVAAGAVDYAPEYRALRSREDLLQTAAERTGGRLLIGDEDVFTHDFEAVVGVVDLWPLLVVLAAIALLLDVAARRFDVPLPAGLGVRAAAAAARVAGWRRSSPRRVATAPERPSTAPSDGGAPRRGSGLPAVEASTIEAPADDARDPQPPPARPTSSSAADAPARTLDELKRAKKRGQGRREWK